MYKVTTHSSRSRKVLNANQIPLQFCQLLKVLQSNQTALQLSSNLCNLFQSLCKNRMCEFIIKLRS